MQWWFAVKRWWWQWMLLRKARRLVAKSLEAAGVLGVTFEVDFDDVTRRIEIDITTSADDETTLLAAKAVVGSMDVMHRALGGSGLKQSKS